MFIETKRWILFFHEYSVDFSYIFPNNSDSHFIYEFILSLVPMSLFDKSPLQPSFSVKVNQYTILIVGGFFGFSSLVAYKKYIPKDFFIRWMETLLMNL